MGRQIVTPAQYAGRYTMYIHTLCRYAIFTLPQ